MGWRVRIASALSIVLCAAVGGGASAGDAEKPFVFDHTAILPGGGSTYFVEGRVHIGKGTEITVQKDTKLVGRGASGGIIEVEGQLEIHGVTDSKVTLQDITIEVAPKFGNVHTDMVVFTGKSGGIVSAKDTAVDGRIFVENTEFQAKATVDVVMVANNIDIQRASFSWPVHVKAVDPDGSTGNKVRLMVMNNQGSGNGNAFAAGLIVEHVADVTVRTNVIGGDKVSFVDCGSVAFDTNYVRCKSLEFVQSVAGRFGKTYMSKCDVQCGQIVLTAPLDPKHPDKMTCDKCWFNGETKEKTVREKFFKDHAVDPTTGVTVDIGKISEKPLQLAGVVTR